MKAKLIILAGAAYLYFVQFAGAVQAATGNPDLKIDANDLGFEIPDFQAFMTFAIRFFFVLAGLLALFYMLYGAISYVTSGGEEGAVKKAQQKIVAAIIGVLLIIGTLSIIAGLELIVFKKTICFGITCPLHLPSLLKCPGNIEPDPKQYPNTGCPPPPATP